MMLVSSYGFTAVAIVRDAELLDKNATEHALDFIDQPYKIEAHIVDKKLPDEKNREHRLTYSKPIVDEFLCGARNSCKDTI
jgi:hypothetical protein